VIQIIIVEHDPVIRIDIDETLREQFPQAQIVSGRDFSGIQDMAGDMIITDLALDRRDLTHWLAQGGQVVVTSPNMRNDKTQPMDGVTYLPRPFSPTTLVSMVAKALRA